MEFKLRALYKNNKTGYKNISITKSGANTYYRIIIIRNNKHIINKCLNSSFYSLEEAVEILIFYIKNLLENESV